MRQGFGYEAAHRSCLPDDDEEIVKCILNEVTRPRIANAAVVLISQRYRDSSAQPSSKNATPCNLLVAILSHCRNTS